MVENKKLTAKEMERKIMDLKIELLKNTTKRKSIKREIARLLTMGNRIKSDGGTK
ncbi:MAG: hypothetical protein ABIF18_03545 [archaeon]